MVVDVGAASASITPIHDGLVLRKGVQRSPLAGNYISNQIRLLFSQSQPQIPLTPHYLISSKSPVDAGQPPVATYRTFPTGTEPHLSFRHLQEERVLTEFKESVVAVWPGPGKLGGHSPEGIPNVELARAHQGKPFEMPDGWNQLFSSVDRYRPVESLFDAKMALTDSGPAPTAPPHQQQQQNPPPSAQTITECIRAALAAVETDIRPHLLSSIVVTGGTSLIHGFTERLNYELTTAYPGSRVRIHAPGPLPERKFGSWIGGSILASLGTFHQMWISKREYEEHGAQIIEKRCK